MTNVIHANMRNRNSFAHIVCKETISTVSVVMYFQKDFYLAEAIDRKISLFLASGIMSQLIEKYVDMRYWNVKPARSGPQELNFKHLKGAFVLWGVLNFCAFIAFVMETIVHAIRRPKLIGLKCSS